MLQKIFRQFLKKNIYLIILINIAIAISIMAYLFNIIISNYFLSNIESDTKLSIWWDIVIDIWNRPEWIFDEFYKSFPYKEDVELAKVFSLSSSIKTDKIRNSTIVFHTDNYPLYENFEYTKNIDNWWPVLNTWLKKTITWNTIDIFGNQLKIRGYYDELPLDLQNFFYNDYIFLPFNTINELVIDDTNSLIDKKYLFKIPWNNFYTIYEYIKNDENLKWIRITNSKTGWDRFWDIIDNLKLYINSILLFSLSITIVIIFLSISSFFINEKKNITILRILWLDDTRLVKILLLFFWSITLVSTTIWVIWAIGIEYIVNYLFDEYTLTVSVIEIIRSYLLAFIIVFWSIAIPIYRFVSQEIISWFREDILTRFNISETKIIIFGFSVVFYMSSIILWYSFIQWLIWLIWMFWVILIIFFIFHYLQKWIYFWLYKYRNKIFILFDAIRSTIKPWNLSALIHIAFFTVFWIILFVLLFFHSFYDRLKINTQSENNFFVINLTQNSFDVLDEKYKQNAYSIIRWRIISINEVPLKQYLWWNPSWRFTREFNITDNTLSELKILKWWELTQWTVSLDDKFAKDLWLKIWDNVEFQIFWITKSLKVINIRESIDYSINPFFFFQVNKEEFSSFPKTYFLSDYIESTEKEQFREYIYDISSGAASFIDVENILEQVIDITNKAVFVIIFLGIYILIFCVLTVLIVILFFQPFQNYKSRLYYLLWNDERKNFYRVFLEYSYLITLNFIFTTIIITSVSYYFFSTNNFLNLSLQQYWLSLSYFFFIYLVFIWIIFITLQINKKTND